MAKFREAQIWEDGLRTDPNGKSFEWWYFDTNFDDGSTLVLTFFTKQAQNTSGPLKPQIQIVYTTPRGERIKFNQEYQPSEFKASSDKCDIKMGPNKVEGDLKTYNLHVEVGELLGDIEFKRVAPSYSTTENKNDKVSTFGWFPAIPYGTVSGSLTYKGVKVGVKGNGYHDHNWGTMDMKGFCDYWYWGRGNVNGYYTVFSVMYLRKFLGGKQASIFYLANDKEILVGDSNHLMLSKTDIKPPRPTADHLPKELTFKYDNNGETVEFNLSNPKLIESADPMGGETGFRKFWSHLFSKPLYVRYNANLKMDIKLENIKDKKDGSGLYEIMILH